LDMQPSPRQQELMDLAYRLAMASALRAGRDSVNKDDFMKTFDVSRYVNLDYLPL